MNNVSDPWKIAGRVLRKLIKENYRTQEDFADDYGADLRTINRYINQGITALPKLQELAMFFRVDIKLFLDEDYANS